MSHDSFLLASMSTDQAIKVFDVRTLDMMAMLRLPFIPSCIEWVFKVATPQHQHCSPVSFATDGFTLQQFASGLICMLLLGEFWVRILRS